jgi:hypothetical protein
MLYALQTTHREVEWHFDYAMYTTLVGAKWIMIDQLHLLNEHDVLWIQHYADIDTVISYPNRMFKIMAQCNGTKANPYCHQIKMDQEYDQLYNIDYNLVFNDTMVDLMEEHYPVLADFYATGFPIFLEKIKEPKKVKDTIVFGGRISPDKQFYLSTFLLEPLLETHRITVCINNSQENDTWLDYYEQKRFEQMGFIFKKCTATQFLNILEQSEFYFSASLGDISSVSLTQALYSGCIPIVPKFDHEFPQYSSYVSFGYEPFSRTDVVKLIREPPTEWSYDDTWFSMSTCVARMKQFLHNEGLIN